MMAMMMIIGIGVERESSNKRLSISVNLSSELTSTENTLYTNKADEEEMKEEICNYTSCDPPDHVLIIKVKCPLIGQEDCLIFSIIHNSCMRLRFIKQGQSWDSDIC